MTMELTMQLLLIVRLSTFLARMIATSSMSFVQLKSRQRALPG